VLDFWPKREKVFFISVLWGMGTIQEKSVVRAGEPANLFTMKIYRLSVVLKQTRRILTTSSNMHARKIILIQIKQPKAQSRSREETIIGDIPAFSIEQTH